MTEENRGKSSIQNGINEHFWSLFLIMVDTGVFNSDHFHALAESVQEVEMAPMIRLQGKTINWWVKSHQVDLQCIFTSFISLFSFVSNIYLHLRDLKRTWQEKDQNWPRKKITSIKFHFNWQSHKTLRKNAVRFVIWNVSNLRTKNLVALFPSNWFKILQQVGYIYFQILYRLFCF